jgi:hypothetical protein
MDQVAIQLFWNYVSVEIVQVAKTSKGPALAWISKGTPWVNRIAAVVASAAVTAGFAYSFSSDTGDLSMHMNAYAFLKALALNWTGIKIIYKILYPTIQTPSVPVTKTV